LITLLFEVESEPLNGGKHLRVCISDEGPAIIDDAGKRSLFRAVEALGREPIERWKGRVEAGERAIYRDEALPLRWASGGILPIIEHRGAEYFALSFRDIFPQGWNLFIGHAGDWDDLVAVERVIEREFSEELLVWNKAEGVTYHFDFPGRLFDPRVFQDEALAQWGLGGFGRKGLSCGIVAGPDSVTVFPRRNGEEIPPHTTEGLFVVIDPRALGIESVRILRIPLSDDLDLARDVVFLDGEVHGDRLLDSTIGLLEVSRYLAWGKGREDLPFAYVYGGGERLPHGMSDSGQIRNAWAHRNEFCPVTAGILHRAYHTEVQKGVAGK